MSAATDPPVSAPPICPDRKFDIFAQLKESTAEVHRQVEEILPIFQPGFDREQYARLVERFYGVWAPLEGRLMRLESLQDLELDLAGRLKTSLLEKDLRTLQRDPAQVPRCDCLPPVDSFARAVGCLYVLEGSTLGARFISQRLETELQLTGESGAAFFNAYGESTGRRWNAFKSFVTARVTPADSDEIGTSASRTFECLLEWLRPAP